MNHFRSLRRFAIYAAGVLACSSICWPQVGPLGATGRLRTWKTCWCEVPDCVPPPLELLEDLSDVVQNRALRLSSSVAKAWLSAFPFKLPNFGVSVKHKEAIISNRCGYMGQSIGKVHKRVLLKHTDGTPFFGGKALASYKAYIKVSSSGPGSVGSGLWEMKVGPPAGMPDDVTFAYGRVGGTRGMVGNSLVVSEFWKVDSRGTETGRAAERTTGYLTIGLPDDTAIFDVVLHAFVQGIGIVSVDPVFMPHPDNPDVVIEVDGVASPNPSVSLLDSAGATQDELAEIGADVGALRELGMFGPVSVRTLNSNPAGRMILVDGEPVTVPSGGVDLPFSEGSRHVWRVPSIQEVGPARHIFSGWSDNGPQNRVLISTGLTGATVTFAGHPICPVTFSNAAQTFSEQGGTGNVAVTADAACSYPASSTAGWITITGGGLGSGSRSVSYAVGANTAASPRTAALRIAGQVIQIAQKGSGAPQAFDDVGLNHPYSDYVVLMKNNGVTSGCSNTPPRYCPDAAVTRGQMAVFITRSIYLADDFQYQRDAPFFEDVPASHPYFKYVQKMKELGITSGCSAARYCPDAPVTRGQMAVFITRSLLSDSFAYPQTPYFADVGAVHPYLKYIQKMKELGITSGCSAVEYCPDAAVTRGQMAVFIIRGAYTPW